jgi:hypothetical protein
MDRGNQFFGARNFKESIHWKRKTLIIADLRAEIRLLEQDVSLLNK